jgi:TonB-linked SusC/RagA family outer membrane protein
MKKKRTVLSIAMLLLSPALMAQDIEVTGTIRSATDDSALPGVNIMIQGTTLGTVTDLDGYFRISVPSEQAVLLISYMGYLGQEILVGSQRTLDVSLEEDIVKMDEVVVVGYGKIKKSDLTGAVSSVKADEIKEMPVTGLDQALQGRAAGVMVTNNTGAPGSGVSIRVRGVGSIARSNEPLYVVDGIPLSNDQIGNPQTGGYGDKINSMANLNPEDIESIEILKDPASCAIYGARGANGVVLITTKRGITGKGTIEVNAYTGVSDFTNRLNLLDSKKFQRYVYEGLKNMRVRNENDPRYIRDWETEVNTDWQEEIFRVAPTSNINLTARGGNEKGQYMISAGYYSTEGIVINTGFDRFSFRSNLDFQVNDRLQVGSNLSLSYSTGDRQRNSTAQARADANKTTGGPIIMSALVMSPIVPVYDSSGNYAVDKRNKDIFNPVASAMKQNLRYATTRFLGNVFADIKIIEGLNFRSSLGMDLRNTHEEFFFGPMYYSDGLKMPGSARASDLNDNGRSWVFSNTLTFSRDFGNHSLTLLGGFEMQELTGKYGYTEKSGYSSDAVTSFSGATTIEKAENGIRGNGLVSYFTRANYSYMGRYMAQINARVDGSSRFGPNNRWGFFPAASVGWNIARESFMSNVDFISELKLRASVGVTGNQEVGDYNWRGSFAVGTLNPGEGDGEVLSYLSNLGGRYVNISNLDYSWEEHTQLNLGLDFSMFRNRIYMSTEWYQRVSDDLLLPVQLPITTGLNEAWANAGKMTNTGYEFTLTGYILTGELKWNASLNLATNNLKVNRLVSDTIRTGSHVMYEGSSIHFYTYVREPMVDSLTGYVKLVDLNGDGQISYGGGPQDRTVTGDPLPDLFGGITNNFSWKGFDLSFFFQFVYGNELYNHTRQVLEDLQMTSGLVIGLQTTDEWFDGRWIPADVEGDDGNVIYPKNVVTPHPRTNWSGSIIDQREGHNGWIEDGSYLRLKTLTFGYTFPRKWMERIRMNSLRLYFTSNNMWTLTNYSGFDPEVSTVTGQDLNANLSIGLDAGSYPQARTYTFGINLTF